MKKYTRLLLSLLLIAAINLFIPVDTYSQPGWSSIIRITTNRVDKNPVFGTVHAGNLWMGTYEFFAFERYTGLNSKIHVMKMGITGPLDTGIALSGVNTSINPSIAYYSPNIFGAEITRALVVWQAYNTVTSKFDIHGSFYNPTAGWLASVPIVVSSAQKQNPHIAAIDTGHFVLTYGMDGDIYFKRYLNGSWRADTNLTSGEPAVCSNPYIYVGNSGTIFVTYEKYISTSQTVINFTKKLTTASWSNPDTVANIGVNRNTGFLPAISGGMDAVCSFESNRSGRWDIYVTQISSNYKMQERILTTVPILSNNFQYAANSVPLITDYSSMVNAYVRKYQDSTKIITGGYYFATSGIYIGDTSKNTKISIGRGLFIQAGFKVRNWLVFTKDSLTYSNLYALYGDIQMGGIKKISNEIPERFSLSQNYPNPFNPTTKIRFSIPQIKSPYEDMGGDFIKLIIYSILGKEVTTLVDWHLRVGEYEVEWNAADYPAGVYFYKIQAGDYRETKKMILVK